MILERVWVKSLRNIEELQLSLHPRCNVIVGQNGSGKTSLLESIYLLSRGQSFRTRSVSPLIQFDKNQLMLHGKTFNEESIFIEKDEKGQTKALVNQKRCQRVAELSQLLPCQLFHQDLFQIIDASSQIRRRLLDWGLFYLESDYARVYREFKRVLNQRNQALKQRAETHALQAWNKPFVELSSLIDGHRKNYAHQLNIALQQEMSNFSGGLSCELDYHSGWNTQLSLEQVLIQQEALDRKHGYTHSGPHHADLGLMSPHGKGKVEWSRGQQKFILILLKMAQAKLFSKPCLFLFDDLMAELDEQRLNELYGQIRRLSGQIVFTALDDTAKALPAFADSRWFYLNQGQVQDIIDL